MKVAEKYTDTELIAAISSGKDLDPAIHSLYRQFSEAIRSFIMSYGGNEQDADDVFQETVIALRTPPIRWSRFLRWNHTIEV